MNKFKISIFSIITLIVFSLAVIAGSQVFAHGGDGDLQGEDVTKEEFMNMAEARYEFMEKIDRLPEDMTKEEYMEMQRDLYSMYEKYGDIMGSGMMMRGFGEGCPMYLGSNKEKVFSNDSNDRGFFGGGMMGRGMMF